MRMIEYHLYGYAVYTAENAHAMVPELLAWERSVGDAWTWVLPYKLRLPSDRPCARVSTVTFEVLPHTYGIALPGAAIRISPRFWYSSLALMKQPSLGLGEYGSEDIDWVFSPALEDLDAEMKL
ncbi:hypothetical protein OH77DRAFT_1515067 [Trametes cingulata]|nr:hypothetical protein OH77DRAFT_1515067 [Trametes cingulata]